MGASQPSGPYAAPTGLGQAFNFELLEADWDPDEFPPGHRGRPRDLAESGSSSTWVLANHDVVRHATRYGLPAVRARPSERPDAGC